jgi:hypothetical protein
VGAKLRFSEFVAQWRDTGYFGDEYSHGSVDNDGDRDGSLGKRLAKLYGYQPPALMYTEVDGWSDDEFCDLIELLYDVAARPRNKREHPSNGFHYSDHAYRTGQLFYRIRVNEILAATYLPFRLATEGEDVGLLVTIPDEARADLLVQVTQQPTPRLTDQVGHAIALYRSRQSTREDKISAIRELMAVLEPDRYTVLKGTAAGADNESLFRIANTYGIRHNKDSDLRDYNTAFLDWMFWAALAMAQLCKDLKAADTAAPCGEAQ